MIELTELERRDEIEVDHDEEGTWPRRYQVADVDTEDLGLAEVVVVAMTAGCDRYTLRRVGGNEPTIRHEEGAELEVRIEDVSIV